MTRLASLGVHNSVFNIIEELNKFEMYTNSFDELSFTELKDELEEILDVSNISHKHLQDKIK